MKKWRCLNDNELYPKHHQVLFPAMPVERMIGILVSAKAASNGKLVKSRLATFSESGVNNLSNDKQPIAQRVSTKSRVFRDLAYLYTSKCSYPKVQEKARCSPYTSKRIESIIDTIHL